MLIKKKQESIVGVIQGHGFETADATFFDITKLMVSAEASDFGENETETAHEVIHRHQVPDSHSATPVTSGKVGLILGNGSRHAQENVEVTSNTATHVWRF